jgi:hypothetical protein
MCSALSASYIFGAVSYHRVIWPVPEFRELKQSVVPFIPAIHSQTDKLDRLVAFGGKREIPCPKQTDRTLVLLIAGQSNAANSGGQRCIGSDGVINYCAGRCYAAQSPLLETTGIAGDSWTPLGNKLIDDGIADNVILIASAITGASIVKWQDGAPLNLMLQEVARDAQKQYKITHVLWHQGEVDVGVLRSDQYLEKFQILVKSIRRAGVDAPIYVSVATRCEYPAWRSDNPIAMAQRSLPSPEDLIFAGVDIDSILGSLDRMDDCHFAASGQEKMASARVKILALAQSTSVKW